jgi:hypothetical protein
MINALFHDDDDIDLARQVTWLYKFQVRKAVPGGRQPPKFIYAGNFSSVYTRAADGDLHFLCTHLKLIKLK